MKIFAASLLAALAVVSVSANKDDTYYGVTNPNINQAMYWHEGRNVLEDLSQFDKLYVTYHNCAWETPTGDDENGGGGGDESDTWYLSSVPSARANVAYTLYGILKGEKDSGCNKKTFINSFHSTQGLESFTNSLASAGLTNLFELYDGEDNQEDDSLDIVTSTCYQDEDGDNGGDDDAVNNGDKYSSSTSYGLGCSIDGDQQFAIHTYDGAYCDANSITETIDELEDLNERLDLAKCVPIYTDGDFYSADDDESVTPLEILATSRACRLHDGTKSCPDPYNQLQKRENALNKATGAIYGQPFWSAERVMRSAWGMIGAGIFLTLAAIGMSILDCMNGGTDSVGKQRKKRRNKNKRSKEIEDDFDAPAKPSRERSELSQSIKSVASQLSQTLGLTGGSNHSKKSKRSNKSNRSKRSSKSERSKRSSGSKHDDPPGAVDFNRSHRSETSNLSVDRFDDVEDHDFDVHTSPNAEDGGNIIPVRDGEESVQESIASKSVQAVNDMMGFLKETAQGFMDEPDDESVEMRIPDDLPQPRSNRSNRSTPPKETEVDSAAWTGTEEAASKKKWRKRRWFKKLIGRS